MLHKKLKVLCKIEVPKSMNSFFHALLYQLDAFFFFCLFWKLDLERFSLYQTLYLMWYSPICKDIIHIVRKIIQNNELVVYCSISDVRSSSPPPSRSFPFHVSILAFLFCRGGGGGTCLRNKEQTSSAMVSIKFRNLLRARSCIGLLSWNSIVLVRSSASLDGWA